ncbi:MAG: molybdenum cofactor carrier protein [Acidobacteria bacterium]|nr:molybdenum cofactor carrier protein [Acidobacteriota bacterium]
MNSARRPVIGVMGSSTQAYEDVAEPLGRLLAMLGVHMLNGGGVGAMGAASRGFADVEPRAGLIIGILPADLPDGEVVPRPGYPNPWIDIAVFTHLPLSGISGTDPRSRNHINILTSDVVVVLPGSEGTQSEMELSMRYGKPVIAFFGEHAVAWDVPAGVPVARTLDEVERFVRTHVGDRL